MLTKHRHHNSASEAALAVGFDVPNSPYYTMDHHAWPEPLYTVQQASIFLNIHVWKLRRAIKAGFIPSHSIFNSRRLVRLSEVIAAIDVSGEEVGHE